MPFLHAAVQVANANMGLPGEDFAPGPMLEAIKDSPDLLDATEKSGLLSVIEDPAHAAAYTALIQNMPDALDAGMLAAMRSALGRGLRVQLVWQAAASYEVRMWESSKPVSDDPADGMHGMLTLYLRSPEPEEGQA